MNSRIFKWAAAGALALGSIPAIGLAHSHASLPTNSVTVTPTGLEAPAVSKARPQLSHAKSARVVKTSLKHKHTSHHVKTASTHSKKLKHHVKKASHTVKRTSSSVRKSTPRM